jgi:hypothetical protein
MAGAVLALGLLGLAGDWGLARWTAWREQQNLANAETAFFAHDFARTRLLLEQAVQVNPRDLDARRQLAEFYGRFNLSLALDLWREAVVLEPERDAPRLALAACALQLNQPEIARETLAYVSAVGRDSLEFHRLEAGLAMLAADRPALVQELEAMTRLDPGGLRAQFDLAALQLVSPDPVAAAQGRAELVALARGGPLCIRATLELLRSAGRSPHPETEWNQLTHEVLPEVPVAADWMLLVQQMEEQPVPEPNDAAALINWMGETSLAREALVWFTTLEARDQAAPAVRQAQAGCAAHLHDWVLLQSLLSAGAWGAMPVDVVTLAFAARRQREGAHPDHARDTWGDALDEAQAGLPALQVLLRLSGIWAWPEATEATLWHIADNFPGESSAWRALAAGAEAEGDSTEAWKVVQAWAHAQPANPAAQAQAQWFGVLLNQGGPELPTAARAALLAPEAAPEARAAGALLLLRAGQADEARAALMSHEADFVTAPRAELLYGVVLAATGQADASERWLSAADKLRLLPQERALLDQARARNGNFGATVSGSGS